ncbi:MULTISPECIES: PP2C family protein-serine/threonine phosphatase [unclassified Cyanobium]|uniref:PP2C family protein-serine/threonine phosphatase n=1 Tax=unclassified Cyanobium TaxID=2627006 RepID=UPI0020CD9ADD|nr:MULTISPECIES: SpoIIE family protein phosphatase [unclassified Cyanobium]MCP9834549.1 SpoIIE family protein phosphatase [Cyanobium sp. La Preciosa 7G6]MCP9937312.1 SpoIIE family protein phosphatase [Cyanobium sp. Aljojuca 7A6]
MEGRSAPISILLVDDDRIHSRILEVRLRAQGYQIVVADSGDSALVQARLCPPTVILCDWLMDGMNGLDVCRAFKAEPALESAHFILLTSRSRVEDRVEGLDCGADDFLSKPVDPEELLARVRSGIRLHQANERLKALAEELREQKLRLDQELEEAASYVRSLLPKSIGGAVRADSRFEPCHELGDDSFDFFWLDDDHFVVYLADGSGHGLAAAFPSISVHNQLRSRALPADLRDPGAVLQTLNAGFPMERHQGRYLTLWYGVYQASSRTLRFASAGHPPALLWSRTGGFPCRWLKGEGMAVGLFEDATYATESLDVGEGACLLVYSDGLYEVPRPGGVMGTLPDFMELVEQCRGLLADDDGLDRLLSQIHDFTDNAPFTDDYSVIRALLS